MTISYLFISHDLHTVEQVAHDVAVMYLGEIVETGPVKEVFKYPEHPYTKALRSSVLWPDPAQRGTVQVLKGEIPSPVDRPKGLCLRVTLSARNIRVSR